jgi:hypothetical protein
VKGGVVFLATDSGQAEEPRLPRIRAGWYMAVPVIPAIVALLVGRAIGDSWGGVLAGILVVIGAPVIAFTRNQMVLTDSGRKLATTVAEVMSLKDADAAAFARPFAEAVHGGYRNGCPRSPAARPCAVCQHRAAAPGADRRPSRSVARPECLQPQTRNFWLSLTTDERSALLAVARGQTFTAGQMLFRQADPARHIYIIRAGQLRITVARRGGGEQIAVRGPGEIVGERAALQVQPRSASGLALTRVRALVVATEDFSAFLERHPRVLDVLERQLYERLTEIRPDAPDAADASLAIPGPAAPAWTGQNCTIFFADVASFAGRGRIDPDRRLIRDALYSILRDAFESSGVAWQECHREDRGDGVLIIVPPGTPTGLLIDPLSERLAQGLAAHNRLAEEPVKMQLRVALHVGPIVSDPRGVSGEAIIQAARILEAPVLKKELAATAADLGVITSAFVYETVIKHLPRYRQSGTYRYRQVRLRVKESAVTAWMCLAECPPLPAAFPLPAASVASAVRPLRQPDPGGPAGT